VASGKDHLKLWGMATVFAGVPGAIAFMSVPAMFHTEPYWAVEHIVHFGMGWCMAPISHPDKDVDGDTFEDVWLYKVAPPLALVWKLIWYPYAKAIEHRDPRSHGVIQGTLIRSGYMFSVLIALIWMWSGLGHILKIADNVVSAIPGFPVGVIAQPDYWLWPWPMEVTIWIFKWMAGRPFEIMWYLVGQELATVISHLLPDKYQFLRPQTFTGGE
jgi:uncharacterized metal-binding protein